MWPSIPNLKDAKIQKMQKQQQSYDMHMMSTLRVNVSGNKKLLESLCFGDEKLTSKQSVNNWTFTRWVSWNGRPGIKNQETSFSINCPGLPAIPIAADQRIGLFLSHFSPLFGTVLSNFSKISTCNHQILQNDSTEGKRSGYKFQIWKHSKINPPYPCTLFLLG